MELGIKKTITERITENLLACKVGSGDLKVFSTPSMIAFMEKASMELVKPYLNEGETTVGTKVDVCHLQASLEGEIVTIISELTMIDRRRLIFNVQAYCNDIKIGEGIHERFVVNNEKFMNKLRG